MRSGQHRRALLPVCAHGPAVQLWLAAPCLPASTALPFRRLAAAGLSRGSLHTGACLHRSPSCTEPWPCLTPPHPPFRPWWHARLARLRRPALSPRSWPQPQVLKVEEAERGHETNVFRVHFATQRDMDEGAARAEGVSRRWQRGRRAPSLRVALFSGVAVCRWGEVAGLGKGWKGCCGAGHGHRGGGQSTDASIGTSRARGPGGAWQSDTWVAGQAGGGGAASGPVQGSI